MSQTTSRVVWALFALILGVCLLYFAGSGRVEFLGIALTIISQDAKLVLLLGGIVSLAVGIILLGLVVFDFDITGLFAESGARHNSDVRKTLAMLDGLNGRDRVNAIGTLKASLPGELSGADVVALLGPLRDSERVDAIRLLRARMSEDASDQDMTNILRGLSGRQRQNAIEVLEQEPENRWQ